MLGASPAERYRPHLLSLLAQAHTVAGFLHYDSNHVDRARWHYQQARTAAYDSGDAAVTAFVFGHRSSLERQAGRSRESVEHAAAAQAWAGRTDSPRVRIFAMAEVADANSADGAYVYAQQALDHGQQDVSDLAGPDDDPAAALFYWIGAHELFEPAVRSSLARREPSVALAAADEWRRAVAPGRVRCISRMALHRADACLLQGEVDSAVGCLSEAVELILQHRSPRVIRHLRSVRARAGRYGSSRALTQFDERAAGLGIPLTGTAAV
jgi:hypothetical protein